MPNLKNTYFFESLQNAGAGDGNGKVDVVQHKQRLLNDVVGEEGQVVSQEEKQGQRIFLQEEHIIHMSCTTVHLQLHK